MEFIAEAKCFYIHTNGCDYETCFAMIQSFHDQLHRDDAEYQEDPSRYPFKISLITPPDFPAPTYGYIWISSPVVSEAMVELTKSDDDLLIEVPNEDWNPPEKPLEEALQELEDTYANMLPDIDSDEDEDDEEYWARLQNQRDSSLTWSDEKNEKLQEEREQLKLLYQRPTIFVPAERKLDLRSLVFNDNGAKLDLLRAKRRFDPKRNYLNRIETSTVEPLPAWITINDLTEKIAPYVSNRMITEGKFAGSRYPLIFKNDYLRKFTIIFDPMTQDGLFFTLMIYRLEIKRDDEESFYLYFKAVERVAREGEEKGQNGGRGERMNGRNGGNYQNGNYQNGKTQEGDYQKRYHQGRDANDYASSSNGNYGRGYRQQEQGNGFGRNIQGRTRSHDRYQSEGSDHDERYWSNGTYEGSDGSVGSVESVGSYHHSGYHSGHNSGYNSRNGSREGSFKESRSGNRSGNYQHREGKPYGNGYHNERLSPNHFHHSAGSSPNRSMNSSPARSPELRNSDQFEGSEKDDYQRHQHHQHRQGRYEKSEKSERSDRNHDGQMRDRDGLPIRHRRRD